MKHCTVCRQELINQLVTCSRQCTAIYANRLRQEKYQQTLAERFWLRTRKNAQGCIRWLGSITSAGYGALKVQGKTKQAHRVAYILAIGDIPETTHVLHKCDNRWCVNPDHLFLGTHQDNMTDKVHKQRQPRHQGIRNPNAKLTAEAVEEIQQLYQQGKTTQQQLAQQFHVGQAQISRIVRKEAWK